MNKKTQSSEIQELIQIRSELHNRLGRPGACEHLQRLAEKTLTGDTSSPYEFNNSIRGFLGPVAGPFVLRCVHRNDVQDLEDLKSKCGLPANLEDSLRRFITGWALEIPNEKRDLILEDVDVVYRDDSYGCKDYELRITRPGGEIVAYMDRSRAWKLVSAILAKLALGGELPSGVGPEIVERFLTEEEHGRAE